MYEPIRQLIRENRIRKAMHAMGKLELSREHSSRLVNLERRLHIIESKQIGNLSEDRLLTIEENGLVQDMLIFLDKVEFPHQYQAPKTTTFTGAAAGAKEASNKSTVRWVGIAAAIIALLTIGFLLWPETNIPEKQPEREGPVSQPTEMPTDQLTYEERRKLAQQKLDEENENARIEAEKKKETLRQQEALKERERQRRIAEAKKEAEAKASFMTRGERVNMAVAVYSGQGNVTKQDEFLTKNLSSFLGKVIKNNNASPEVLTPGFHEAKERDLMIFGRAKYDERLSPKRARYVVLADVRNVDNAGKAQLRMCIYDTSSGKTMTRLETANVGTARQMKEKYILYAVKAFVTEKLGLESL